MNSSSRGRSSVTCRLHCEKLESREVPAGLDLLAVGSDFGPAVVRVLEADTQTERFRITAFDRAMGGVRLGVGDVNGDGVQDIVAATGLGDRNLVRVFNGVDGSKLLELTPYDAKYRGGLSVAVGDVNNDGKADIIVGRGRSGAGKQVRIFSGADGGLLQEYDAISSKRQVGVYVAAADVNGDNRADVVVGISEVGPSNVKVFSGASGKQLHDLNVLGRPVIGGVVVAAGDINGDGFADIITGACRGRLVQIYSGKDGVKLDQFYAGSPSRFPSLQLSTAHANEDGKADIVVGENFGRVLIYDGATLQQIEQFDVSRGVRGAIVAGSALKDGDGVIDANTVALRAIRAASMPPPRASRLLAMVHAAVYDAVNGIVGGHAAYLSGLPAAPAGASPEAAAIAAAHRVLVNQIPAQQALFDQYLNAQLAVLPNNAARSAGEGFGVTVANALLAHRANDGSANTVTFVPDTAPGHWVPTPAAFAPALLPQWPDVTPFTMTSGSQFRPAGGPPDLNSDQYTAEYNEVKNLGSATGSTRTADQTQIALFWADGAGTVTPPGHWNQIARDLSLHHGLSLAENARMFALLNMALADAGIAAWDAKYDADDGHGRWRPVTGIRQGDSDGNDATVGDPSWTPLIATPPFPAYTSGHSTFSSAAATVLSHLFGNVSFVTYTDALPDVARQQANFTAAAQEAGMSRIYGGIHWQSDNVDALAAGTSLGSYVVANYLN